MKKGLYLILCLLSVFLLSGCMKTYTYQAERKDQDLVGNRGIIKGNIPPPEIGRKRSRTMGGLDVELPPSKEYKERKKASEKGIIKEKPQPKKTREVPEETSVYEEPIDVQPREKPKGFADEQWVGKKQMKEEIEAAPVAIQPEEIVAEGIKYTVQKGDTLEKIAKKFLGKTSRWPEIYEANKDTVENASKIYPGQVIVIPQVKEKGSAAEPLTYK